MILSLLFVVFDLISLLNYGKINKAEILFPGVACFLIAVCLGFAIRSSNAADNKVKLQSLLDDLEDGNGSSTKAKTGIVDFLVELENRRLIKVFGKSMFIGLGITFFTGVCFSLFLPAFNLLLTCLSIMHSFYFSVLCFVIAIILNTTFLYHSILNLPKTTTIWGIFLFREYKKSSRTYVLLVSMLSMFIVVVGILMASLGHRKSSSD
ncbi:hypothetical protein UlMin_040060 [Ulmus minor]